MSKLKIQIISQAISRYEKKLQKIRDEIKNDPYVALLEINSKWKQEVDAAETYEKKIALMNDFEKQLQIQKKRTKSWRISKLVDKEIQAENELNELKNWLEIVRIREGLYA